jgi:hypothetical protein
VVGSSGPRSVNWHACQCQSTWWPPAWWRINLLSGHEHSLHIRHICAIEVAEGAISDYIRRCSHRGRWTALQNCRRCSISLVRCPRMKPLRDSCGVSGSWCESLYFGSSLSTHAISRACANLILRTVAIQEVYMYIVYTSDLYSTSGCIDTTFSIYRIMDVQDIVL